MKWTKKGHEFDDVYKEICDKKKFYLFGAGDYGKQFFDMCKNEIQIEGYIDNSPQKQGTVINGKLCISLEQFSGMPDIGIIVTMSQIARISPIEQLQNRGYLKNKNFFIIEEFISIYYVYKYNKVYFSSISFLPSTICNLNCRHCLNFNPFASRYYSREWEALVKDVDLFFTCVDYIMLFHVSGGEPLLYEHTAELIEYIANHYGDKIGTLRTVTNGTIVPGDEVFKKLQKCKVEMIVDDYRRAVPQYKDNFRILIDKLEWFGIRYIVNQAESWIDLAPEKTDYSFWTEEQLILHRDSCSQSWQELRDGKIYSCNYASYASVAGIAGTMDMEEFYDLRKFDNKLKKELVEFRLGFTERGYTNFCKKCRGFTKYNTESVEPAIQIDRKKQILI